MTQGLLKGASPLPKSTPTSATQIQIAVAIHIPNRECAPKEGLIGKGTRLNVPSPLLSSRRMEPSTQVSTWQPLVTTISFHPSLLTSPTTNHKRRVCDSTCVVTDGRLEGPVRHYRSARPRAVATTQIAIIGFHEIRDTIIVHVPHRHGERSVAGWAVNNEKPKVPVPSQLLSRTATPPPLRYNFRVPGSISVGSTTTT